MMMITVATTAEKGRAVAAATGTHELLLPRLKRGGAARALAASALAARAVALVAVLVETALAGVTLLPR